MIVAGYYVFVDVVLVGQWFWYEKLKYGKKGKVVWKKHKDTPNDRNRDADARELIEGIEPLSRVIPAQDETVSNKKDNDNAPPIEQISILSSEKVWRTLAYGSINTNEAEKVKDLVRSSSSTPRPRSIYRPQSSNPPLPFATPTTLLFISCLLTLAQVHASPIALPITPNPFVPFATSLYLPATVRPSALSPSSSPSSTTALVGKFLAWLSTVLYLASRLPQLYKNMRRRSTAGLAPSLFLAAFFGNLFYSSSLLANPSAWQDFSPYGGHGWAGSEGSERRDWILRAMPFFLGAAGVLALDGAVGVQFLVYGEAAGTKPSTEVVVQVDSGEAAGRVADELEEARRAVPIQIRRDGGTTDEYGGADGLPGVGGDILALERPSSWQRVTGWMRGWVPSPQQRAVVKGRVRNASGDEDESERRALLRSEEWPIDGEDGYGAL